MLRRPFLACIHYGGVSGRRYARQQAARRLKPRAHLSITLFVCVGLDSSRF